MRTWLWVSLAAMAACRHDRAGDDKSGDDTASGDSSEAPQPAALVTPSISCPKLPEPGNAEMITFGSGDDARDVWVSVPSAPTTSVPLWFAWHGLTQAGVDPAFRYFAQPLGLKAVSEDKGVVIVAPTARLVSLAGVEVYLWGVQDEADHQADLAFYDDLRACLATDLDIDLTRVSSFGFSGGALWTSVLIMDRADTLASFVTWSGGVDILNHNPVMAWRDPGVPVNAAIYSGGPNDAWPSPQFSIINFGEASDALATHLNEVGDPVIRCQHTLGHSPPPPDQMKLAWRFLSRGVYGVPSDWFADDPPALADDCSVLKP